MCCIAPKTLLPIVWLLCLFNMAHAQFAPAAGLAGSTAISKGSSIFSAWATGCSLNRGPMDISNPSLGIATAGDSTAAVGVAGENGTVSLGDGGIATLTFASPIFNGDGADFAVFENGFTTNDSNLAFLELAFVEVSSDGIRYVRFPAISNVEDTTQIASFAPIDGSQTYNLAGKYVGGYGTPFDLDELKDSAGIDINNINYVKIIDVVGSINNAYATYDHLGHKVNDPWSTAFASSGFDLDAVGVIHAKGVTGLGDLFTENTAVYPNPVKQGNTAKIALPANATAIKLFDLSGRIINEWTNAVTLLSINTNQLPAGIYFITGQNSTSHFNTKLVVE